MTLATELRKLAQDASTENYRTAVRILNHVSLNRAALLRDYAAKGHTFMRLKMPPGVMPTRIRAYNRLQQVLREEKVLMQHELDAESNRYLVIISWHTHAMMTYPANDDGYWLHRFKLNKALKEANKAHAAQLRILAYLPPGVRYHFSSMNIFFEQEAKNLKNPISQRTIKVKEHGREHDYVEVLIDLV